MVRNRHSRSLGHPAELVGECLDALATENDVLWPLERWPRMAFDTALAIGARGGHGPVRYVVEQYRPGREVVFRFTNPAGFRGTHRYRIEPTDDGCELEHVIEMGLCGVAMISWPLVFRPLHDALLEDSLDKVEAHLAGSEWHHRGWSPLVRTLRRLLAKRRRVP